jgi:signal transduction histidine kinase/ActR/RegA family two-component response regulator
VGKRMSEVQGIAEPPPYVDVYAQVVEQEKPAEFDTIAKPMERIFREKAFPVSGARFGVVFEDITDRRRAEDLARVQRDLGLSLSMATDIVEASRLALEAAMQVSGMDSGGVYLVDQANGGLRLAHATGLSMAFTDRASYYGPDSDPAQLTRRGTPFYASHHALDKIPDLVESNEQLRAAAIIPIRHGEQVVACLNMGSHSFENIPGFAQTALEAVANQIGAVVARMQADTALQQKEEQLRQVQKMEALGRLAGGVAHDFDNILANIMGYASLVRSRLAADSPFASDMDIIVRSCQRASDLTAELLTFARGGVIHASDVDLNAVVQEVSEMLWERIDPSIDVQLNLTEDLLVAKGDAPQLHQVVLNLAMNACDAILSVPQEQRYQGGLLTIETSSVLLDEAAARALNLQPKQYACLSVSDTGKGMDEETQKRIFDPFFTTKSGTRQHSGLGLATVFTIVQAHRGVVKVGSTPGAGATFVVYLPLAEQTEEPFSATLTLIPKDRETILVVDDDPDLLHLAHRLLDEDGYVVLDAAGGVEAIKLMRDQGDQFALIILDMLKEPMDAGETYRQMRAMHPNLKVLLMSGYSSAEEAQRLLGAGVAGHLRKPYSPDGLLRAVRRALDSSK